MNFLEVIRSGLVNENNNWAKDEMSQGNIIEVARRQESIRTQRRIKKKIEFPRKQHFPWTWRSITKRVQIYKCYFLEIHSEWVIDRGWMMKRCSEREA